MIVMNNLKTQLQKSSHMKACSLYSSQWCICMLIDHLLYSILVYVYFHQRGATKKRFSFTLVKPAYSNVHFQWNKYYSCVQVFCKSKSPWKCLIPRKDITVKTKNRSFFNFYSDCKWHTHIMERRDTSIQLSFWKMTIQTNLPAYILFHFYVSSCFCFYVSYHILTRPWLFYITLGRGNHVAVIVCSLFKWSSRNEVVHSDHTL